MFFFLFNSSKFIKEYKACTGGTPSVWKVFVRVYKKEIFYAGLARLVYDLACLVGPLALNGVVAYTVNYGKPNEVIHFDVTFSLLYFDIIPKSFN